jgi:hypothetical protein
MKVSEVDSYLRSLVSIPSKTVDRIIIGSPETVVDKIGTAWMPYWDTCRQAVLQGINRIQKLIIPKGNNIFTFSSVNLPPYSHRSNASI